MLCVWIFVLFIFSMHKAVRPEDIDKVANLAQHPKRFATAAVDHAFFQEVYVRLYFLVKITAGNVII